MRDLIIFGAGDVGKFIAYNISLFDGKYSILGFMDEDENKVGNSLCGLPVFGIDYLQSNNTDNLCMVIAISSPKVKENIIKRLLPYDIEFPNFISSNSWLSKGVKSGRGIIIYPNTTINYESEIEDFVIINAGCSIGHNVTIGQFATLAPGVKLAGFTRIDKGAELGIGCCTRQGIRVGSGSIIGGQTMLIKDVEPGKTVVGIPGKVIE